MVGERLDRRKGGWRNLIRDPTKMLPLVASTATLMVLAWEYLGQDYSILVILAMMLILYVMSLAYLNATDEIKKLEGKLHEQQRGDPKNEGHEN